MDDARSAKTVLCLVALGATLAGSVAVAGPQDAHPSISFSRHVRPIFQELCVECHAKGRAKGRFSIDTRETMLAHEWAVDPGNGDGSLLVELVRGDDPEAIMPKRGRRLTDHEIAVLTMWIDQGAEWDGPLFAPVGRYGHLTPRRPELPRGDGPPIDRVIAAQTTTGTRLTPVIDDAAFLRRVSLDLVGLLPAVDELDAFLADERPDKRERLVAALLDDRQRYAEHWVGFWNDLLRNDYAGTGYIDGGRTQITGWLLAALAENKPYNRFVAELVDPVEGSRGFANGIKWRGKVSASQRRELQYARSVGRVFLGINMKCASCHDSFVDDWKLSDAYGLAAIIADEPLELHRCDVPTGEMARAQFIFPAIGQIDADASRETRLAQFASLMTHPDNGRLTRTIVNRLWARLMGRGLVEPVDEMAAAAWCEDLLDFLATHLTDNGYDLKATMRLIATSRAYQRVAVAPPEHAAYVFAGPVPQRMTAEQLVDAVWSLADAWPEKRKAALVEGLDETAPIRASLVEADRLMRILGRPMREQIVTTRPNDLTTLQALELTNGATMQTLVERGATGLRERFDDTGTLVNFVFRSALSRPPTRGELDATIAFLGVTPGAEDVADFLWVMIMLPEFQLVR